MPDKDLDDLVDQTQRAITTNRERRQYNHKPSKHGIAKLPKWRRQLHAANQHKKGKK